jgi:two-component system probable response regulator PhcQ
MNGEERATDFAVLFVDDEEKARKYFRMAYARDFPVLTADGVPEAVKILEKQGNEIGVLITDQRMPGQQGVELLRQARQQWPQIVRMLTTAYSDLEDAIVAVNRGEIIRYITKPWDIDTLRVELRHAMDFFELRRERDLLISEKVHVRQQIGQSQRLRCLIGLAAGAQRLRHVPHALAAWTHDDLLPRRTYETRGKDLELWGSEVTETLDLMKIHRHLRELDDSVEPGFLDRVSAEDLVGGFQLVISGQAPAINARLSLLEPAIRTLFNIAGEGGCASLEPGTFDGVEGLKLTLSGPDSDPVALADSAAASDPGLLQAYVIAWHHGGRLQATRDDGIRFELTLPADPLSVVLPAPDADWLTEQFAMLEDWG